MNFTNQQIDQLQNHLGQELDRLVGEVARSINDLKLDVAALMKTRNDLRIHHNQFTNDLEILKDMYSSCRRRLTGNITQWKSVDPNPANCYIIDGINVEQRRFEVNSVPKKDIKFLINSFNKSFPSEKIRIRYSVDIEELLTNCLFSPDGQCMAFSDSYALYILRESDGTVLMTCKLPNGKIQSEPTNARAIKYSPDGKLLALSDIEFNIHVFDVAKGEFIAALTGHKGTVSSIAFSLDSEVLASSNFEGEIIFYDMKEFVMLNKLDLKYQLDAKDSQLSSIQYISEDGILAAGFLNGNVAIFDQKLSQPLIQLAGHDAAIFSLDISHGQTQMITTGGHDIKLWEIRAILKLKFTFFGHKDLILCSCFSPNDDLIFSGGKDETLKIWNTRTGELLYSVEQFSNSIMQVCHHPKNRTFACCVGDGKICVFDYEYS